MSARSFAALSNSARPPLSWSTTIDPQPSRQDIDLTRELIAAAKPLGIAIHDHIVVGTKGQASLRASGLM